MKKDILSFKEFCNHCDISPSRGYKASHNNELPYYKPSNGKIYFKVDDVNKWLLQNRVASAEEVRNQSMIK